MQLTWDELLKACANRLRESDDETGAAPVGEPDIPYYSPDVIEASLLEISQQILREIDPEELEAIGSEAIRTFTTPNSPQIIPDNTIRIVSVTVQPLASGTLPIPAQPVPPATFIQNKGVNPTLESIWSVFDGNLYFTGWLAVWVIIIEPNLSEWRTPVNNILPDGYNEEQIDRVVKQLQIMNFEPQGGI